MTRFLHWRKMTWAILLWGVAMTAWLIAGGAVVTSSCCGCSELFF